MKKKRARNDAASATIMVLSAALASIGCGDTKVAPPGEILVSAALSAGVAESGTQTSLTVALSERPHGVVTVPVASSDPSEATVSVGSVTFTRDNWNGPQTVVITGVDDAEMDGD